jgi:hypothetical protein
MKAKRILLIFIFCISLFFSSDLTFFVSPVIIKINDSKQNQIYKEEKKLFIQTTQKSMPELKNIDNLPKLSLEKMDFPEKPRVLHKTSRNLLLIGTFFSGNSARVYRYNGTEFEVCLEDQVSYVGVVGIFEDYKFNIYVSFYNGKIWRSEDDGKSWEIVAYIDDSVPSTNWADMKNGSILAACWTGNRPYIYRSDQEGRLNSWYLWLNFTEIFPEYAYPAYTENDWYAIRHIHSIVYESERNEFLVSFGDIKRGIVKLIGDNAKSSSSWQWIFETDGPTGKLIFEDRILWAMDRWVPLLLYNRTTGTCRYVLNPEENKYSTINIFQDFAYDKLNNTIYFSTGCAPAPYKTYPSILASKDRGETWEWIHAFDYLNNVYGFESDLQIYQNYLYIANQVYGLLRFQIRPFSEDITTNDEMPNTQQKTIESYNNWLIYLIIIAISAVIYQTDLQRKTIIKTKFD